MCLAQSGGSEKGNHTDLFNLHINSIRKVGLLLPYLSIGELKHVILNFNPNTVSIKSELGSLLQSLWCNLDHCTTVSALGEHGDQGKEVQGQEREGEEVFKVERDPKEKEKRARK